MLCVRSGLGPPDEEELAASVDAAASVRASGLTGPMPTDSRQETTMTRTLAYGVMPKARYSARLWATAPSLGLKAHAPTIPTAPIAAETTTHFASCPRGQHSIRS